MPFSLYIYSRCFRLSCVSILNIFFPLFEATFQIIFTLKSKICFNQFVCAHQIYKSTWHWFNNKQPYRLALTRFVIWQDLLFDKQVVSTICSKSANIKLQQVWFSQTWSNLMRSTDLLQVARTDLSRLVIHKLDASCFNNLQQVNKYQVATSLIFAACISIDAFNRLAASCSIRLVKTCCPQACCKLLQQLAASLQISSCSKSDFTDLLQLDEVNRLAATCWQLAASG